MEDINMTLKAKGNNFTRAFLLFALFLVLFLDGFGQSFIFPILTRTMMSPDNHSLVGNLSIHAREMLYGVIIGIFFICWMIGAAVLGDLSDIYGRKKGLIICMLGMIFGNMLTAFAFMFNHVWLIILGRIIIGFTAGSQAIAQAAIVDMSQPGKQARNMGLILLAVTLGAILGPAYGDVFSNQQLSPWFTNQTPFFGVMFLCLLSLLILLFFYQDIKKSPHKKSIKFSQLLNIFKDAFTHPKVRILLFAALGMFGCWAIYYFYMTIYLVKAFNASSGDISIYMSLYGLGASLGMAFFPGIIERYFSTKQAVVGGWSLLAFAFLLTQFSPWLMLDFILAVFAGFGVGIGFVFTITAFSVQVPLEKQGWVMGIFNASWVGMMGISVLMTGYIANLGIAVPFIVGYVLFLLGIALFISKVPVASSPKSKHFRMESV